MKQTIVFAIILSFLAGSALFAHCQVVSDDFTKEEPEYYGVRAIEESLERLEADSVKRRIVIDKPGREAGACETPQRNESFAIFFSPHSITVSGSDPVGTMYGCYELADLLGMRGWDVFSQSMPIRKSPDVEFRAVNPFLTLPYEEHWDEWWFLQEDYWEGYLDTLSRARFNWIDLHGMYDIETTHFPNLFAYFVTSERFPDVGVEPELAKRNLDMLKKVMKMARARGIKFAIMSYHTGWKDGQGLREYTSEDSELNIAAYTSEAVHKMIEECPLLEMVGFRIGESGRKGYFFKGSYIPAIRGAAREVGLYTRSWGAKKKDILEIGEEFPGRFSVEIKYNGEHLGPPYIIAGGRMEHKHSYSYQDYYSYPKNYEIIYQIRTNGTLRVFPWCNPVFAARAVKDSTLGGARGFSLEPMNAYYPKNDYRHPEGSKYAWYTWQYERDRMFYNAWGRTAYDLDTAEDEELWRYLFAESGYSKKCSESLYDALWWSSLIVPDCQNAYCIGPDHRQHAPELELGGTVEDWAGWLPFDTQNIQPCKEFAYRQVKKEYSARKTPIQMADIILDECSKARNYLAKANVKEGGDMAGCIDLAREIEMTTYLGEFYAHKLKAAAYLALMKEANDVSLADKVRGELAKSHNAWRRLAKIGDEHYKPFVDTLRMKTTEYSWQNRNQELAEDYRALNEVINQINESEKTCKAPVVLPLACDTENTPTIRKVDHSVKNREGENAKTVVIECEVGNAHAETVVAVRAKPFPSETAWKVYPMQRHKDGAYTCELVSGPEGIMWCVEVVDSETGCGSLWPDFRKETPYIVVMPWE